MRRIRISLLSCVWAALAGAQDFATLAQRAVTLQEAGQFADAALAYGELLRLDPKQVVTHVNLGVVLAQLGRYDEAIAEYQAADRLLPHDQRIGTNLALAYEKSGRLDDACPLLETLHEAHGDDDKLTLLDADCAGQRGQDARVVELLQPIAARHPDDLSLAYMLGNALLHEHREREGAPYLDLILKNGDTAEARFLMATRAYEAGDFPGAVQGFARAAELNGDLPGLSSLYGQALLNTGDPDTALAAFRKQLGVNASDFMANLCSAEILNARKQYADALPLARRAHELRPENGAAALALAQGLAAGKEYAQARPLAVAAVAQQPFSFEAHRTLAAIDEGLGNHTDAKRETAAAKRLQAEQSPKPHVNDPAPDFELPRVQESGTLALKEYRGKSPVMLVFGSYTCPNFRDAAGALQNLEQRYGRKVPFVLVYIREAHSTADWQSTRNNETLTPAATLGEKQEHAQLCRREFHLRFPAVVDTLDGAVEAAYHAWPSRAFLVGADGRVQYTSSLTELDFHADDLEAALRRITKERAR